MFDKHNSEFWDRRYGESDYAYGIEPNAYLVAQKERIRSRMQVLVPGDGEGRNSVWLARQGADVLAVDLSEVGLKKAVELAQQANVTIRTECSDLTTRNWKSNYYDLIVSIYLHFSPDVRVQIHQGMLKALKPGGMIILEAFTPAQLEYQTKFNSGGPPVADMLYSSELLKQDFKLARVIELEETEVELQEGRYHSGLASVVRGVWQK